MQQNDYQGEIATDSSLVLSNPSAEDTNKLVAMLNTSNDVLISASAVFPFDLFPDTITVDRHKVTITKRSFFMSAEVMSIRIEDVLNATTTVGPLFGSIKVISRVFNNEKPVSISHLTRGDAIKVKHLLQGYVIALQKHIDCSSLKTDELIQMLSVLGHER